MTRRTAGASSGPSDSHVMRALSGRSMTGTGPPFVVRWRPGGRAVASPPAHGRRGVSQRGSASRVLSREPHDRLLEIDNLRLPHGELVHSSMVARDSSGTSLPF